MKPEDLMVGDWVILFDKTPVKVDCIGNVEVYLSEPNGQDWRVTYEHIKPIPLTQEILEKNGFKKLGFDGWEFDYETEGGCLIYEVLWRCDYPKKYHTHLTIKSCSPDFGSFKSFRIDSVHELQHALRLCGIEKEIVL